jgi:hypothetical protein
MFDEDRLKALASGFGCLTFGIAGIWLLLITVAQLQCSQFKSFGHQCGPNDGMIWLIPFVTSLVGFPAFLISAIVVLVKISRRVLKLLRSRRDGTER